MERMRKLYGAYAQTPLSHRVYHCLYECIAWLQLVDGCDRCSARWAVAAPRGEPLQATPAIRVPAMKRHWDVHAVIEGMKADAAFRAGHLQCLRQARSPNRWEEPSRPPPCMFVLVFIL